MTTLFLCGDVMTGRGVDQILRHPGDPALYERHMRSAVGYVQLAESVSGPIPRGVDDDYVWGTALDELDRAQPDATIVNLETAVTDRGEPWPGKGIHYRMHPENAGLLGAAGVTVATLANNHVMDWGREGLVDTVDVLGSMDINVVGAGMSASDAWAPGRVALRSGLHLAVVGVGLSTSGIPGEWAAGESSPGVALIRSPVRTAIDEIAERISRTARDADLLVVTVHWGPNWGYDVPQEHRRLAHALIDQAGADIVHGHSSHHPMGIEVHRGRLILYGCGDFINDYEGIAGHESYRPRLCLMYFAHLDDKGELESLEMVPGRLNRFRVERAGPADTEWLADAVSRAGEPFGTSVAGRDSTLVLRW